MKTAKFIERLESIRGKDRKGEMYIELLNRPVTEVVDIINQVDEKIAEEEIDKLVAETVENLKKHIK